MPKTIKFIGTQQRWPELAVTGRQSVWFPGQTEERGDSEAALLLSTGLFDAVDVPVLQDPATGALVASGGARERGVANALPASRRIYPLLSVEDANLWPDRAGAGMTVAVDNTVLFNGRPTLRLTIPAGSSGTYRVGTTLASVVPPYNWDGKQLLLAIRSSNLNAVRGASVFFGDAAFANFQSIGGGTDAANVPEAQWQSNEWIVGRGTSFTPTGTPNLTVPGRIRVNFPVTSVGTETQVWIGFLGVTPANRPTAIVSIDDGYLSGYTFIRDLARYYRIPVSFGIDSALVGTANYMTAAMIQELHADPSDLFEIVTHGVANTNLTAAGSAANYVAQQVQTRNFLRSLGVLGDGPNHHPWVQSLYSNEAIAALRAAGFKSARIGGSPPRLSDHDGAWWTGEDKRIYQMLNACTLTTGLSLAQAQTAVTGAVTEGYGVFHINAHDFAAADAASPPTWSFSKAVDFFGWLRAQEDAGAFTMKSWGRWYADLFGTTYLK